MGKRNKNFCKLKREKGTKKKKEQREQIQNEKADENKKMMQAKKILAKKKEDRSKKTPATLVKIRYIMTILTLLRISQMTVLGVDLALEFRSALFALCVTGCGALPVSKLWT